MSFIPRKCVRDNEIKSIRFIHYIFKKPSACVSVLMALFLLPFKGGFFIMGQRLPDFLLRSRMRTFLNIMPGP